MIGLLNASFSFQMRFYLKYNTSNIFCIMEYYFISFCFHLENSLPDSSYLFDQRPLILNGFLQQTTALALCDVYIVQYMHEDKARVATAHIYM